MNVMRRMPRGRDSEVVKKSPTQMRIGREGGLKSYKSKARNFSASLPKAQLSASAAAYALVLPVVRVGHRC